MVTEFERWYSLKAHSGTIRLLAYLNKANMGSYQEAIDNGPGLPTSPQRANIASNMVSV